MLRILGSPGCQRDEHRLPMYRSRHPYFCLLPRLRVVFVSLLAIFTTLSGTAEEVRFPLSVLGQTFPEPSELSQKFPNGTHPDFPNSDANEVTRFWKLLREDFSALLRSTDSGAAVGQLTDYIQVRDAWLQSGSLTRCILAATITMAIDEYLTILVQPGHGLSEPDFTALTAIATQNDVSPEALLAAFDKAWPDEDGKRVHFADVCATKSDSDFYDCWIVYLEGLGLEYGYLEPVGSVGVRFIARQSGSQNRSKEKSALVQRFMMSVVNGWDPVYVLHKNDELWAVAFLANMLDEQQIRRIFWKVASPVASDGKTLRIGDSKEAVAAFEASGKRWLAYETVRDESLEDHRYFDRDIDYADRRGGFFDFGKTK